METTNSQSSEKGILAGFLKVLPLVQWAATIAIAIALFGLSTRDTQTVQASEISRIINEQKAVRDLMNERKSERDKQVEELKKIMLTKDIFEAYHQNDVQRMERMEKMMEQILQNGNR